MWILEFLRPEKRPNVRLNAGLRGEGASDKEYIKANAGRSRDSSACFQDKRTHSIGWSKDKLEWSTDLDRRHQDCLRRQRESVLRDLYAPVIPEDTYERHTNILYHMLYT